MSSDQNAKVAQGKKDGVLLFKASAVTHVPKAAAHHESLTLRVH